MSFRFQNRDYSIRIAPEMCQRLAIGQTTNLKHLDSYPDVLMFPNENTQTENLAWIGIFLFSAYITFSSAIRLKRGSKIRSDS